MTRPKSTFRKQAEEVKRIQEESRKALLKQLREKTKPVKPPSKESNVSS